ncbi:MAG: choice-of-anchor B family protein [Bacteroidota bacterium]
MRYFSYFLFFLCGISFAQTPCSNGFAGDFPCEGYDLLAHITSTEMGATGGNDSWGWTDPQDGKEYAIVGLRNGTAFIDISTPTAPVYLGKLPTATGEATTRDIKTYNNYAFVVSDNNGSHGMQVFDLTRLRNVANPPVTFTMDAHYQEFENAHNIAINEETGYAYALRTNTFSAGVHFIDIQDPLNPIAAGGYTDVFTHDAQVIIYDGPDTDYTGREILFSYNGFDEDVTIVDVTDKGNPQEISNFTYSNNEHAHQGWVTEDHEYIIMGDEFDELNLGVNTRTVVFDITDLDNPTESFVYAGATTATDHNGYVLGDSYFLASYNAGMRVMDISDIGNGNMSETGYFDVYPDNDQSGFNGAWSVYPYFASGNIVISALGSDGGFFLVRESSLGLDTLGKEALFAMAPNPAGNSIELTLAEGLQLESIAIYDRTGRLVLQPESHGRIDISALQSGMYLVRVNTYSGSQTERLIKR